MAASKTAFAVDVDSEVAFYQSSSKRVRSPDILLTIAFDHTRADEHAVIFGEGAELTGIANETLDQRHQYRIYNPT